MNRQAALIPDLDKITQDTIIINIASPVFFFFNEAWELLFSQSSEDTTWSQGLHIAVGRLWGGRVYVVFLITHLSGTD